MKTSKETIAQIREGVRLALLPAVDLALSRDAILKYMDALRPNTVSDLLDDLDLLEKKLEKAKEALDRYAEFGQAYVRPIDWNSFKMGGLPEIADCESVDVGDLARQALAEIEATE